MKKVERNLPPQLARESERLAAMADADVDLSDAPEVVDWSGAERGKFYRPVKQQLTLRLDADVVQWFKDRARDGGYQTRINEALRRYVQEQRRKAG
ncbi:MAG: BrnA antitoxin family protein [Alphaproteobacteria bacterium]|nr:BrnA antitoxin family protein [Alphaproteobacteria bacterium]